MNDFKFIFKDDVLFQNKGKFKLKLVHKFFDINFYLSNFELVKDASFGKNNFNRYFISNCYNNNRAKNLINQYYFAFLEFLIFEYKNKKLKQKPFLYNNKSNKRYMNMGYKIQNILDTRNDNEVVNLTSSFSIYEEESYHTQGSYFHIVMMLQKKIEFIIENKNDLINYKNILSASIIENLCFAYIKSKKEKYLSRVKDGLDRLRKQGIRRVLFYSLQKNINSLRRNDIRREIYILLEKLSIKPSII